MMKKNYFTAYIFYFCCMIYAIYQCLIDGNENNGKAILAAVIGLIVVLHTELIELLRQNKQHKISFEKLENEISEKHTLSKAENFHNLEMNKIEQVEKQIDSTYIETSNRVEKIDVKIDTTYTDVKILSNSFDKYITNILSSGNDVSKALNVIELQVQKTGELQRQLNECIKENEKLKETIEELQTSLEYVQHLCMDLEKENNSLKCSP